MSTYPLAPKAIPGLVLCAIASVAAGVGLVSLSLIDQVLVLGVAVVAPLALGGPAWSWTACGAAVLGSFLAPTGWAAVGALPFAVAAAAVTGARVRQVTRGPWSVERAGSAVAGAYAVVAAGALAASRGGRELAGIGEPIVELTAVHYLFAGTAALTLACDALGQAAGRWRGAATAAVVLTAAAPPVVAAGFVTAAPLPQVGGAVLMAGGVLVTAGLQLRTSFAGARRLAVPSLLLAASGLAVWVPMALAVAWAAGQHSPVPALSIPDMARTHGLPNALGFALCGLAGRRTT